MSDANHIDQEVIEIDLAKLSLDASNPRFGGLSESSGEASILDHIVEHFGVDDVISSLAVNGYFAAEPLVVRRAPEGRYIVAEGNRRLAACLILHEDPRGANQTRIGQKFRNIWHNNGRPKINPVPCLVFEDGDKAKLLSYLGVRHIASAQPWDSYAKAAWVAEVVDTSSLSVEQVSEMIGDQYQTIRRLLEGYNLIQQLRAEDAFDPKSSLRRGRGSVTEYPFSWVYTILGHRSVRDFLNFGETGDAKSPVPEDKIPSAKLLLTAMFGDRNSGRSAAIADSRQLRDLAMVVGDRDKTFLLKEGKSVEEIIQETKPIETRLSEGLQEVRKQLQALIAGLSEEQIQQDLACELVPLSGRIKSLSIEVNNKLKERCDASEG